MKLKTFEVLFALKEVDPSRLDEIVNDWLNKNRNIMILHRDFHTRSGRNDLNQPYTYLTLLLWYVKN